MILTNFATDWRGQNFTASYLNLLDVKSVTMAILLQQLGLAEPERSVLVLHKWDPSVII